jgi:hypothetical protein
MNVSFAKMHDFRSDVGLQERLLDWFPHAPRMFWSNTCVDHNGFFGSHTSSKNVVSSPKLSPASSSIARTGTSSPSRSAADHQEYVSTYFHLIVKVLRSLEPQKQASLSNAERVKDYIWHEMGFLSFSSNSRSTMLCFDIPQNVIGDLQHALSTSNEHLGGPYGLHVPLLEELVKLYDHGIWAMAQKIRGLEKVSETSLSETLSLKKSFALITTDRKTSSNDSKDQKGRGSEFLPYHRLNLLTITIPQHPQVFQIR